MSVPTIDKPRLSHRHDGCEWNPELNLPSLKDDRHFRATRAVIVVGGQIRYRLCHSCAQRPQFRKMRVLGTIAPTLFDDPAGPAPREARR